MSSMKTMKVAILLTMLILSLVGNVTFASDVGKFKVPKTELISSSDKKENLEVSNMQPVYVIADHYAMGSVDLKESFKLNGIVYDMETKIAIGIYAGNLFESVKPPGRYSNINYTIYYTSANKSFKVYLDSYPWLDQIKQCMWDSSNYNA